MHHASHRSLLASALAVALLVETLPAQVCGPGTTTQTITYATAAAPTNLPWQDIPASLPAFDPALGTLIQATVSARVILVAGARGENTAPAPCNLSFSSGGNFDIDFVAGGLPSLMLSAQVDHVVALGAFDGNPDFRGTSGFVQQGEQVNDETLTVVTDQGLLQSVFTGPGTVDFLHDSSVISLNSGCGTPLYETFGNGRLELTVAYTYCATSCIERNRRLCGSLLLYPEFDNRPGIVTLFTVTDGCCDTSTGNTQVEFRFINKDNCLKTDQTFTLTPCDQLTFITSGVNSGGTNKRGYAYVYAKNSQSSPNNPTGTPIVWNHLIGHELVLNGITSGNYGMNAVSFRGIGLEGEPNDDDGDGIRDLDGPGPFLAEYDEAPEEILIPRFMGQDDPAPSFGATVFDAEIILINLSGGSAFTTVLDILGYNDNEEPLSAQYTFRCWDKPKLRTFAAFTKESFLDGLGTNDPDEVVGASHRESGWMRIDGLVANSSGPEAILDPAIYAVLVEHIGTYSAADLPFEQCSQDNGDLLPNSIFGDGPNPVAGDNQ